MSQKLAPLVVVIAALAFPTAVFAINQNGPSVGIPVTGAKIGAGMNRGIAGAAPFRRGVRVSNSPQVSGPIPKK